MEPKRREKGLFLNKTWYLAVFCTALFICSAVWADYKPADGPLMTRWAKQVSAKKAHPEYPRPQMVREDWLNLNGLWEYAIEPKDGAQPEEFDGQILVPFCAESALSGVMKTVGGDNHLWYQRNFEIPRSWKGQRILLHFGAVDWDATVTVNGKEVGTHRGGYDPFTFDITDALNDTGKQRILVSVWDPTNAGSQPRGKQVSKPRGIWYTAVTGIWQSVWLEPVPQVYIKSLRIVPDIDAGHVRITADCGGETAGFSFEAEVKAGWFDKAKGGAELGKEAEIALKNPKLWSPDSPHLYDLKVSLKDSGGKTVDTVSSYFGMRKIEVKKDESGINRLFLNNKVLFQYGPLDQGWWPDGLYTAPTDAALRYDIEVLKKLGCNMLRKHVKVEPRRFYYWCDKLGLMVWQDMPSGNNKEDQAKKQFELELTRVIGFLQNHPSIVMWVPFNEGWGQHDSERYVDLIKKLDPTRLVNHASGWADKGVSDVHDIHKYPGPAAPPVEENRAAVLGEFGGLGLPVKEHTWQAEKNWGYRSYETREALTEAYVKLLANLRSLIGGGLSAAVYTQTTDVEIEVNGLMTYDRAMVKMDAKKATAANRTLYLPPPVVTTIVPTSQQQAQQWRYTTSKPGEGWEKADFDDSAWQKGLGGFGAKTTPGTVVRTTWNTSDIWIRRTFELDDAELGRAHLSIHHDEDAEVYINGRLVTELKEYTSSYARVALDNKALKALKAGTNCIAVHCHQTTGGQYIDVGLVKVAEPDKK